MPCACRADQVKDLSAQQPFGPRPVSKAKKCCHLIRCRTLNMGPTLSAAGWISSTEIQTMFESQTTPDFIRAALTLYRTRLLLTLWTFSHFVMLKPQTTKYLTWVLCDQPTQSNTYLWSGRKMLNGFQLVLQIKIFCLVPILTLPITVFPSTYWKIKRVQLLYFIFVYFHLY